MPSWLAGKVTVASVRSEAPWMCHGEQNEEVAVPWTKAPKICRIYREFSLESLVWEQNMTLLCRPTKRKTQNPKSRWFLELLRVICWSGMEQDAGWREMDGSDLDLQHSMERPLSQGSTEVPQSWSLVVETMSRKCWESTKQGIHGIHTGLIVSGWWQEKFSNLCMGTRLVVSCAVQPPGSSF